MSIFRCDKCGCIENTALSNYWSTFTKDIPNLCSECDPKISKWHNRFPRQSAVGYWLGNDGFLYHQMTVDSGELDWRIRSQGFAILKQITDENSVDTPK